MRVAVSYPCPRLRLRTRTAGGAKGPNSGSLPSSWAEIFRCRPLPNYAALRSRAAPLRGAAAALPAPRSALVARSRGRAATAGLPI